MKAIKLTFGILRSKWNCYNVCSVLLANTCLVAVAVHWYWAYEEDCYFQSWEVGITVAPLLSVVRLFECSCLDIFKSLYLSSVEDNAISTGLGFLASGQDVIVKQHKKLHHQVSICLLWGDVSPGHSSLYPWELSRTCPSASLKSSELIHMALHTQAEFQPADLPKDWPQTSHFWLVGQPSLWYPANPKHTVTVPELSLSLSLPTRVSGFTYHSQWLYVQLERSACNPNFALDSAQCSDCWTLDIAYVTEGRSISMILSTVQMFSRAACTTMQPEYKSAEYLSFVKCVSNGRPISWFRTGCHALHYI